MAETKQEPTVLKRIPRKLAEKWEAERKEIADQTGQYYQLPRYLSDKYLKKGTK